MSKIPNTLVPPHLRSMDCRLIFPPSALLMWRKCYECYITELVTKAIQQLSPVFYGKKKGTTHPSYPTHGKKKCCSACHLSTHKRHLITGLQIDISCLHRLTKRLGSQLEEISLMNCGRLRGEMILTVIQVRIRLTAMGFRKHAYTHQERLKEKPKTGWGWKSLKMKKRGEGRVWAGNLPLKGVRK